MDKQHADGPGDDLPGAFASRLRDAITTRRGAAPAKLAAATVLKDTIPAILRTHAEDILERYNSGDLEARYNAVLETHVRTGKLEEKHVVATLLELLVDTTREIRDRLMNGAAELEREVDVDAKIIEVLTPLVDSAQEAQETMELEHLAKHTHREALAEDDALG